jgi:hypothetical protein
MIRVTNERPLVAPHLSADIRFLFSLRRMQGFLFIMGIWATVCESFDHS